MSKAGIFALAERALTDQQFGRLLETNPDVALAGFDLTPEEVAAIKSKDPRKLQALGYELDERISKGSIN